MHPGSLMRARMGSEEGSDREDSRHASPPLALSSSARQIHRSRETDVGRDRKGSDREVSPRRTWWAKGIGKGSDREARNETMLMTIERAGRAADPALAANGDGIGREIGSRGEDRIERRQRFAFSDGIEKGTFDMTGADLKTTRLNMGLTPGDMAHLLGVNFTSWYRWEATRNLRLEGTHGRIIEELVALTAAHQTLVGERYKAGGWRKAWATMLALRKGK